MGSDTNFSNPSGFIEFLPGVKRLEIRLMARIAAVFERHGFTPIETPAVERLEVLQAKGNQGDNIIYAISPIVPAGEKDDAADAEARGLKFDQTVPLAAYIARHQNELSFPFARYQMDMVWRGERAKAGRYRQFRQCDIDVVGRGELPLLHDAQVAAVIAEVFEALAFGEFLIRINNRRILTGFFASLGVPEDRARACLRAVDAMEKIGERQVSAQLKGLGLDDAAIARLMEFTKIGGTPDDILARLDAMAMGGGGDEQFRRGVAELREVARAIRDLGVPDHRWTIDLSIARGLNYYTGTVYETSLVGHESLGSICSGGRYEELVGMFVGEKMPGVGISIGLTRLLVKLLELGVVQPDPPTPVHASILNLDPGLMPEYLRLSSELRRAGLNAEVSFSTSKLKKQMESASKRRVPIVVLVGSNEIEAGTRVFKDMATGQQHSAPAGEFVQAVRRHLGFGNA